VVDSRAVYPGRTVRCEFCRTRIRWIHVLEHDDYPRTLAAGCCCAARLCYGYDAGDAEREAINRACRLLRFTNLSRWTQSRNNSGNIWRMVRTPDGRDVRVTVFVKWPRSGVSLARGGDRCDYHSETFASQSEAMRGAFDWIESRTRDP
jgi:hypothetical protein